MKIRVSFPTLTTIRPYLTGYQESTAGIKQGRWWITSRVRDNTTLHRWFLWGDLSGLTTVNQCQTSCSRWRLCSRRPPKWCSTPTASIWVTAAGRARNPWHKRINDHRKLRTWMWTMHLQMRFRQGGVELWLAYKTRPKYFEWLRPIIRWCRLKTNSHLIQSRFNTVSRSASKRPRQTDFWSETSAWKQSTKENGASTNRQTTNQKWWAKPSMSKSRATSNSNVR